ncbi:MAG: MBL fold metallo-hydrolase [Phycisphaerales bacterium JB039]
MADTRYRMTLLSAGPLLLDGGGMFGIIPRVVWTRFATPDDRNRIALRHNCLLLEEIEPAATPRRIVIETGTGDKLDAKMRAIFGLDDTTIETALAGAGAAPETITDIIVSHLHFDHAGGLTRRAREGETADWDAGPMSGDARAVKLTFPNARIHIQKQEWEDALAQRSVMTRTYYADHLEPLRDHLELCDAPAPFPHAHLPDKTDLPPLSMDMREREILPGVFVFRVPGHTWGQQAVRFTDEGGRQIVFTPDVMPTAWHLGAAYSLAYDVEPYTSMLSKRWLLHEAAERGWILHLDHEPGNPLQTVSREGDWFALKGA